MAEPRLRPLRKIDPKDERLRPKDNTELIIAVDDKGNVTDIKDLAVERRLALRRTLEKEFGELTDKQFALSQQEGGFLAFQPGARKQAVAFRFERIQEQGKTGWKIAKVIGEADLEVYVDDTFESDLGRLSLQVKRGLDAFVKVAGDKASRLTREMYWTKETSRTQRAEYGKTEGFSVRVTGGEVKLVFGTNKKGELIIRVVGVSGKTKYTKGATYLTTNLPQELQAVTDTKRTNNNAA